MIPKQVYQCSGTIIDNFWVLSAAHCCEGVERVTAVFGEGNYWENDEGEFALESTQMFNHPDYGDYSDGNSHNTDYCLIKFPTDILAQVNEDT